MKDLIKIKESLVDSVKEQVKHLDKVDAEELSEVIDMIKDLEEAMYYCTIVEAMEKEDKESKDWEPSYYYTEPKKYKNGKRQMPSYPMEPWYDPYAEDMYYDDMMMYANRGGRGGSNGRGSNNNNPNGNNQYTSYANGGGGSSGSSSGGGSSSGSGNGGSSGGGNSGGSMSYAYNMDDMMGGKSAIRRKAYIQGKQAHNPKQVQLTELEHYVKELSSDLVEMIEGASPEEKTLLQKKISELASKIQ